MKTLIASTALALTLAAPGFAQMTSEMNSGFVGGIETQGLRASDLMGARLYVAEGDVDLVGGLSTEWDDVGEISDIVVGGGGDIDAVLLDIGGFLGIGERTVAVNMDSLQFVSDGPDAADFFVVMQGNREVLEAAPEFNQEFARGRTMATQDVQTTGTGMTTQDGEGTVVEGQEQASLEAGTVVDNPQTPATAVVTEGGTVVTTTSTDPAATTAEAADATAEAAGDAVTDAATDVAAATDATAEAAGDAVTDAATDVAQAGDAAVEATEDAATDVAQAADTTVTTTGEAATAATAGAVAAGGAMMARPNMTVDGYEMVEMDALTTEDVTGAAVYGIDDQRIGEIGELVMTADGQLQDAIIDVGGFLGLGEKPVAVSFESLQVLRGEGGVRVYVDTTEEALTELPRYEN